MPLAVPVRRGRRQAVPGLVEQLASEDKGPRYVGRRLALTGIGVDESDPISLDTELA